MRGWPGVPQHVQHSPWLPQCQEAILPHATHTPHYSPTLSPEFRFMSRETPRVGTRLLATEVGEDGNVATWPRCDGEYKGLDAETVWRHVQSLEHAVCVCFRAFYSCPPIYLHALSRCMGAAMPSHYYASMGT